MAFVTNTLENQSIVLKTWGRGAKANNVKIYLPLRGVKIEELAGGIWSILTFIDPFTQKEVKLKKFRTNYYAINPEDKSVRNRYGIPGFEGFTDKPKRERKKKKPKFNLAPLPAGQHDARDAGNGLFNVTTTHTMPLPAIHPRMEFIASGISNSLNQYIGAPINQHTIATMQHEVGQMVRVVQDKLYSDRLNIDMTFEVPPRPLKFLVTDQEIKYENRNE